MIGLPFQTTDDLAGDLLYMKKFDIDMCGMGPYIEHADTPLAKHSAGLLTLEERFDLTLKMIAVLRIIMKDINIVAATALQAIDPIGREKAVRIGANIIMPNITPGKYRDSYKLYDNKPCTDEAEEDCQSCLEARISLADSQIIYSEWGDSIHYIARRSGMVNR
jgi:biotin synthase